MAQINYYAILGVTTTATDADIKKAYRDLSKIHHPDMGGDENKFKEINEAFSVLGTTAKRQAYDNPVNQQQGFRFEDFFQSFGFAQGSGSGGSPFDFFGGGRGSNNQGYHDDLDIVLERNISLKDIYNDTKATIEFDKDILCHHCDGLGVEESKDSTECLMCDGKGRNGHDQCDYCNGSGMVHSTSCKVCHGDKVIRKKETISIDNIFVLQQPQRVSYRGMGHASRYYRGRRGDVYIMLKPEVNPLYIRQDATLSYRHQINFLDAIVGGEFLYTHLDGKTVNVKIPAGINNGHKLKLSGFGMLQQDKRSRGDLYMDLELTIDYSSFNTADIAKLKKTKKTDEQN